MERDMTEQRPIIVVMTPVRNEAWVLRAFLEATSLWADYIVIADQMSTDGSREIAKEYPKVILIENNNREMHQAATRRLLFEEVKKIKGDKILFALDADEFLSGDFVNTDDWEKILNSKPGDMFCWKWMNLKRNDIKKYSTGGYYYWGAHESDSLWKGEFPDNVIHEWRIPWIQVSADNQEYYLDGFCSIHLARVNEIRQRNKERFYQVSTITSDKKMSFITMYRYYHSEEDLDYVDVPQDAYAFYEKNGLDIWKYVDRDDEGQYYTTEILNYFNRYGIDKYALLGIWDKNWVKKNGIKDPRSWVQKFIHYYLSVTMPHANAFFVRMFDKLLKLFV